MPLEVHGLERSEWGLSRVRVNYRHRGTIKRYGLAVVTNVENGRFIVAVTLGHETQNAISMGYDERVSLGLEKGDTARFTFCRVSIIQRLKWYVTNPDPAIHIPAWLSLISVIVGLIGITPIIFPQ